MLEASTVTKIFTSVFPETTTVTNTKISKTTKTRKQTSLKTVTATLTVEPLSDHNSESTTTSFLILTTPITSTLTETSVITQTVTPAVIKTITCVCKSGHVKTGLLYNFSIPYKRPPQHE